MDIKSLFASLIAAVSVFTFLSLPILREMYGDVALLAVYGGLGLLVGIFVYIVGRKIRGINFEAQDEVDKIRQDMDSSDESEEVDEEVVETEIENLKNG